MKLRYAFILMMVINTTQASTGVSCLIEARFQSRLNLAASPDGKVIVNVAKVTQARDDTQQRNDFKNCATQFKKGARIQFNTDELIHQRRGTKIWLNYIYGDDRGGARWEHYIVIPQTRFKEH